MKFNNNTPRYEALDSDETRLPAGMERIGYDEQTSTYTYLDHTDGTYWEGEPGSEFGELHRQGQRPAPHIYSSSNKESCGYFLPFVLIICTVLGTLFWYVDGGTSSGKGGLKTMYCGQGWKKYTPVGGDTCWSIAEGRGISVEELVEGNQGLVCEELKAGWGICVPVNEEG